MTQKKPVIKKENSKQAMQVALSAAAVAAKAAKDISKLRQPAMTALEMEDLIEKVSARVIAATFAGLGVDLSDKDELKEIAKDREYTRAWRQTIQKGTRTSWLTFIAVATTGFCSVLFIAVKLLFTGHP